MFPIHLDLGFRTFYFYEGLYILTAMIVAYIWAAGRIRKSGLSPERFDIALVGAFVGLILGARISHFLFWDLDILLEDPMVFFRFWDGGLSVVGGLVGGLVGAALTFIGKKEKFLEYYAVVAPSILLGQAVGRIGCFMNGDAWGLPTSLPWGVRFAKFGTTLFSGELDRTLASPAWTWARSLGLVAPGDLRTPPLHPTQLYEAAGDIVILFILLLILKRVGREHGGSLLLAVHAGGYCLLRFLLEFIRGDRGPVAWAGMSALQISLALGALASLVFAVNRVLRLRRVAA
jgi:phosphatidylglycerol:prolipoprotein diacylglycerol transferase